MVTTALERLSQKLDIAASSLTVLDSYYSGTQPLSFLSPIAKKALGDRLRALAVNYPRLCVDVLAERLRIEGFRSVDSDVQPVWESWLDNGMPELQHIVTTEALALGSSYVTVWAGPNGNPSITIDSAREMAVERHPVTREVTAAAHRWLAGDKAHAVLFEPHVIGLYESVSAVPADSMAGAGQGYPVPSLRNVTVPTEGWQLTKEVPNPMGRVPVVAFVNRGRLLDVDGVSEMTPILDLSDALNKLTADLMVSSEFFARPRRWATGIETQTEDVTDPVTGEITQVDVSPFGDSPERVWTSEAPDSRFGEFPAANLAGYTSAVAIITNQIGALSGLPPHMLGVHSDQPSSADGIRSAESALVQRAIARQRNFGRSWAEVASLISMVSTGKRPTSIQPVWADPETRTPAQAADAASKLVQAGILPVEAALDQLGFSPEQILSMRGMRRRDALDAAMAGARAAVEPKALPA